MVDHLLRHGVWDLYDPRQNIAAASVQRGRPMDIVDKLKDSYSFLGDPLHREAWERIERLETVLGACSEYLERYADVIDGDDGIPEPNGAAILWGRVRVVLEWKGNDVWIPE